ncbi:MAG: alpha/beta fold hydrolase, partial [Burkholderiaceae bacterium]
GIDVFIEGQGDETIVMIHGWPDTYRLWDEQVDFFKAKYRCVRFTLPGFDIGKPCQAFSLQQTIQIFKSIMEKVSPDQKVILMLHDWGCVFGYQFAMQHQAMVSKIIGVDIGDMASLEADLSAKAKCMILAYQMWLALAWRVGGRLGDKMTRSMARALRCKSDPQYIGVGMNYPYYITWFKAHGSYDAAVPLDPPCPMLFMYGTKKPFMFHSRAWAEQLGKKKDNQVLAFDTSHWVMRDQPEKFNQAVDAWLSLPLTQ